MIQHSHKTEIINNFTVLFTKTLIHLPCIEDLYQRLCIIPGIPERGTECRELGEWRECYIPGNVAKISGECCQTFREHTEAFQGMPSKIPGNVTKHSGARPKTFRGVSLNILGNALKHLLSLANDAVKR